MEEKLDPYAALRFKEFNFFLIIRFILVFGWSMQFIIIEWEVYSLTKDPLSLGLIGLVEVVPAISMALFAGHIVDQREKKLLFLKCIIAFLSVAIGYYFITSPYVYENYENSQILIGIYILVFLGGFIRAFIGPTIFSLVALIVPKSVYPNAATWSSSTWQLAIVLGPALIRAEKSDSSYGVIGPLKSLLPLGVLETAITSTLQCFSKDTHLLPPTPLSGLLVAQTICIV